MIKQLQGKHSTINSGTLDFWNQGLSHSEVEQAEEGRFRQLADKIEAHPHKECRQPLQRKFEEDGSRIGHRVLRIMRNGFHSAMLPSSILLTQVKLYCTCGLCFNNTEDVRKLDQGRFHVISISNMIIRKKSLHGARHGNSEEQIN